MSAALEQLHAHLGELQKDPILPINEQLIDKCCQVLPLQISKNDTVALVQALSALAPTLHSDPTSLNRLLIILLEPFSFSDILSLSGDIDFVAGLDVKALPYNRLLLSILQKAALQPADASTIAGEPQVILALVNLWLCTPEAGIAHEAGEVLFDLLVADQPHTDGSNVTTPAGNGLVWKRVFQDKDVYGSMFSMCTADTSLSKHDLSRNQRTLAQSRLLEILPRLCVLNWSSLTRSQISEVEASHVSEAFPGLLGFAALRMVDTADDILMHKCLIDFYTELLMAVTDHSQSDPRHSSVSLDYLIGTGIHERLVQLYTNPSEAIHGSLEVQFLYSSAAGYVAAYASQYPDHFMDSQAPAQVMSRLTMALSLSPGQWAHQESPRHDLHVLTSLPRVALLPRGPANGNTKASVISLLPTKHTSADCLNALATIFKGPVTVHSLSYPDDSPMTSSIDERGLSEAQAAKSLYFLYIYRYNSQIFADLVSHAESVALTDSALAAINVIKSIVASTWAPLSDKPIGRVLTEAEFVSLLPSPPPATPSSGPQAVLAPPSLEHTIPYLLKPARSFSNLVGGRGDTESAAYKVAVAKFDALKSLHDRLVAVAADEPDQGYEDILSTLARSLSRGPWAQQSQAGSHIATMEL